MVPSMDIAIYAPLARAEYYAWYDFQLAIAKKL